jgi:hypothetical protein
MGIMGVVHRVALTLAVLALALAPLAPRAWAQEVRESDGDTSWTECMDESLLEYNECLMSAGTAFSRMICDIAWQLEVVRCTAEALGEIRQAFRGGD